MTAERFATLVREARRSGAGYVARCPAHDDEHASLSFADGNRGLVVKCHAGAGCSVARIAAAVKLRVADLFADNGGRARGDSHVVAEYEYRDEHGELLFVVERREPKTFRQRRPDGRGGWAWSLDGVRRVLYRLPELRAAMSGAPAGTREALIVEGEKDAEALAALGIPATTNAGGAGKWGDEYTEQLRAAGVERVAIFPDNDGPGEAHACSVARSCLAAGLEAKIVRLPGLRSKGDVSDWRAAGHTGEDLAAVVTATPLATTEALASEPAAPGESSPVLVCLADVEPESVSWLWPSRLARGKLTLLVGDPGVGKSFVMLDVSARISTGREWPDGGRALLGDVILLSAEDGVADTIRPRVDALAGDAARIHVLRAVKNEEVERPFNLASGLAALERAIADTGAALVVIDPLSAYLGDRDSYKDPEVRALLAPLAALAERTGVAVGAIMHIGKAEQRRAIHRTLGSVAFVAAARIVLAAGKDPADESRRLLVPVKSNLSAPAPALAYRLDGGKLEWEPEPVAGVDADAVLGATPEDCDERRDADELLRELLAAGERKAAEVLRAARENGIPERTLNRAKRRLGIKARHEGQPGKHGGAWYWFLAADGPPNAAPDSPKTPTPEEVAAFGETSEETDESARTSPKTATVPHVAAFDGEGGSLRSKWGEV